MKFPRKLAALSASAACLTLALSGCGADAPKNAGPTGETGKEPVTLSLATFNEFGYEDLLKEYETLNPNVTIQHKKAATTNEARDNLTTRLAAGSGLSDIEAIEVDWLSELKEYPGPVRGSEGPCRRRPLAGLEDRGSHDPGRAASSATARTPGPRLSATTRHCLKPPGMPIGPRICRQDARHHLGQLLRRRQEVRRRRDGPGMVRLRRSHLPGHEQPDVEGLRERGRHGHRRRQPGGQGGLHQGPERLDEGQPLGAPGPVEQRLGGRFPVPEVRHDPLPGLDARCH